MTIGTFAQTLTRILAVADESDEALYGDKLTQLRPDIVVSCGDLPFDYLEYLVSRLDVPLLFVPGNHDPSLRLPDTTWSPLEIEPRVAGPAGCVSVDGRIADVVGVRVAGLGGSLRYKQGPNQYSQTQMRWRALKLEFRVRLNRVRHGRKMDVLLTHAPPFGVADAIDPAHKGFVAFNRLIRDFHPVVAIHGHIHPYGKPQPERLLGSTRVINAIPSRIIEIE